MIAAPGTPGEAGRLAGSPERPIPLRTPKLLKRRFSDSADAGRGMLDRVAADDVAILPHDHIVPGLETARDPQPIHVATLGSMLDVLLARPVKIQTVAALG